MSYIKSSNYPVALGLTSWKRITARADDVINRCLFMGASEGGSVIVESCMYPVRPLKAR